ncbi:MAG: Na+/H+ antiporter NhaC [Gemmatimonadota bacterium]
MSDRGTGRPTGPETDTGAPERPPASPRALTLAEALLPILTMLVLFVAGVVFLQLSAELLVAVLLGSAAVAGIIAVRHGCTWDDIQRSTGDKLASVLPAVLILLSIGMLIATWVLSGTIPFMVYWGVRLVSPRYLVLTAFLATATMSLFTGTSWGSAGTIGVALMGTAAALHAPLATTAGAVVSGAYLGDKMSPLSDSTNISAIGAGAQLYRHIRHMMYTATPSFILCLVVYTLAARLVPVAAGGMPQSARTLLSDITSVFSLNWLVLLPPAIVIWSIIRKNPPALAIAASSLVAAAIGVLLQGFALQDAVISAVGGFHADMVASVGADPTSLGEAFRTLVNRGGLYSMANTLIVIIAAFLLAGAMDVSGALNLLIDRMLAAVRSVFGLIGSTMAAGGTMIALTSHGGVTALVIGELFQKAYDERSLARVNLSRSIEDSVTITEPLMPWTVSAVFMATTLGVPTIHYAPWACFCYGGPVFSLLIAGLYRHTGFGIRRAQEEPRPQHSVPPAVL